MSGTGFGRPKSLLTVSSANSSHPSPSTTTSMLPVPPPPSISSFKFQNIGQQPGLLKRFSETGPAREPTHADVESPSDHNPDSNPDVQMVPRSRPTLFQALAENDSAFASDPPVDHNLATSSLPTTQPFTTPIFPAMTSPPTGTASTVSNLGNFSINPQNSIVSPPQGILDSTDALGTLQLGYPDPSPASFPAPDRITENRTSAQRTGRPVARSASPKLEELRDIRSQLQDRLLNLYSPNLSSALVLTQSVQMQAAAVVTEARQNLTFAQETSHNAQKSLTAAQDVFRLAKHVQDIAESVKVEVDRLSEKNTQCATELGEIREILQSLDGWISERETSSQARAPEPVKRREELRQSGYAPNRSLVSANTSPPNVDPGTHTVPSVAPERLFLSATPEVETKFATQLQEQSRLQNLQREEQIKRQTMLRRLEEERRRASADHPPAAPMEMDQDDRQRSEELRRKMEEARMREEQRQKEEARRREEEEKTKREDAKKQEAERKAREAARALKLKKAREEAERKGREAAVREAQEEAKRKAQEEAERKAQEEAEKKAQEEEKNRQDKERKEALERERIDAFLDNQKRSREKEKREAEEAKRRARQEEQEREERMLQENARQKAEKERQIKLREQQEIRRQQIQNDKSKIMADRALQIRTEREQRIRSLDTNVDDMSLEYSPTAPFATSSNRSPIQPSAPQPTVKNVPTLATSNSQPASSPTVPRADTGSSIKPLSLPKHPPIPQSPVARTLLSSNAASGSNIGAPTQSSQPHRQGNPSNVISTPPTRQISLPPVAHYSPKSPVSLPPTPETPRISVHRQSGDAGNLPFHRESVLSPQSQAANLRHVVNSLQLPPLKFSVVKQEPVQEDSLLLPGSERPSTTVPSQSQVNIQTQLSVIAVPPRQPSLPKEPSNNLRSNPSPELHILSSSTAPNAQPRPEIRAIQRHQLPQNVPTLNISTSPSEIGSGKAPPQKLVLANGYSRSASPLRMGPVIYNSPFPSEMHSEISPEPRGHSPPRGRPGNSHPQKNWDHYSPSRSPPPRNMRPDREMDSYRPYPSRPASPIFAGRKRSRESSPVPRIRDYRDYDDRWLPQPPPAPQSRRFSRSPPRRVRRVTPPPQRSPSPPQNRPPLALRLTQGTANESYPPREPKSSRPDLLDRFNEPNLNTAVSPTSQPTKPLPKGPSGKRGGKGGGKHGKRGGRGGGVIIGGPSHASLEQRISSGTTLMNRLEEHPR